MLWGKEKENQYIVDWIWFWPSGQKNHLLQNNETLSLIWGHWVNTIHFWRFLQEIEFFSFIWIIVKKQNIATFVFSTLVCDANTQRATWSEMCELLNLFVLLQNVFGHPTTPRIPESCVYIMWVFNLFIGQGDRGSSLSYTLNLWRKKKLNLIIWIIFFFASVFQLLTIRPLQSHHSLSVQMKLLRLQVQVQVQVLDFRAQHCPSLFLTWKWNHISKEKKTLSSGISFCLMCTLTHTVSHSHTGQCWSRNVLAEITLMVPLFDLFEIVNLRWPADKQQRHQCSFLVL